MCSAHSSATASRVVHRLGHVEPVVAESLDPLAWAIAVAEAQARVHARVDLHAGAPPQSRVCSRPRATIFSRSADRRDWSKRSLHPRAGPAGLGREGLVPRQGADLVVAAPQLADVLGGDGGDGGRDLTGPGQERLVGDDLDDEAPVAAPSRRRCSRR